MAAGPHWLDVKLSKYMFDGRHFKKLLESLLRMMQETPENVTFSNDINHRFNCASILETYISISVLVLVY